MTSALTRLGSALLLAALGVQLLAPPTVLAPGPVETAQKRGKREKGAATAELRPFLGGLAAARKAAHEQNVPLLVHVILEGEPQNDDYRDQLLPHQQLMAASAKAVVLIANNGDHQPRTLKENVEGRVVERQVCSKYRWFATCSEHRAAWDAVYTEFADEDGEMHCPQTVIELPDGQPSWRFNTSNPPEAKAVIAELNKARKKAGPGLTADELRTVKTLVKDAGRATDGKLWGDAWRGWHAVLAIIEVGKYGEQAARSLARVESAMSAELDEVTGRLRPGTAAAAYAELDALVREWAATDFEARVRVLLKRAEKEKSIKQEVAEKKLELEAERVWDEAQELLRAGQRKGAEKLLKKLLRKKYGRTPAARRVRETYPDLG